MTTRRRSTLVPKPVVPADITEDTIETPVKIDAVDEVAEVSKDMAVAALFVAIPPAPNCGEIAAVAKPEPRYLLRNSRHSAYIRG
jgi:hypothetical protein